MFGGVTLASTSEYVDGVQYGKSTESISMFRIVCTAQVQHDCTRLHHCK